MADHQPSAGYVGVASRCRGYVGTYDARCAARCFACDWVGDVRGDYDAAAVEANQHTDPALRPGPRDWLGAATERPSHPVREQPAERSAGAERGTVRRASRPPKSRRRLRPERRWDGAASEPAAQEPPATAAERNGDGQTTEKPTPTITIRVESEFDLTPAEVFGQRVPPKFTAADVVAVMEAEGPKPEVLRRWYLDDPGLVTVTVRRRTAEAWASSPGRPRAAQR